MPEFEAQIEIDAPPVVVFAHLVDAERMVTWMGEHADLHPVPGGGFAVDSTAPAGTFRFAEFLGVGDGKIHGIRLVFDATEFRKLAAAAAASQSSVPATV